MAEPTESTNQTQKSQPLIWAIAALVILAAIGLAVYFYFQAKPNTNPADISVATVNGVDISQKQLDDVVAAGVSKKDALDKLIKAEVLDQYLKANGASTSEREITQNIKAPQPVNAATKLDSKLDLLARKMKAIFALDDVAVSKKYETLKAAAKIEIHIQT